VTDRWTVLAGSVGGGAHARAGCSSQDAYSVDEIDGVLLVTVADGAGSAPLAAVGAAMAVAVARREFGRLLRDRRPDDRVGWQRVVRHGGECLLRRFRQTARAIARVLPDTAPGAVATAVTVVAAHAPWTAVFSVGDGLVVVRTGDGDLDLLLAPPGGTGREPGRTTLLTSPYAAAAARRLVARIPDLTGLAVSTDGLDTLLVHYDAAQPVRPGRETFDGLFALAEPPGRDPSDLTRLLAGQPVGRLTDDDRTLVLAVPR
jgi:hypothetical protein